MLPPPTLKKILFMDFKKKMVLIFFQVYMMIVSFNAAAQSANELFTSSIKARNIGNFDEAEKYLQTILNTKDSLTTKYKVAVYNQQGLIMKDLGRYSDALDNFEMAESICINEIGEDYSLLSLIYNNMAIIYKINNDYEKALEYYNVALNSLKDSGLPFKKKMYESSKIHHNIGNVYKHLKKFKISIESFELSKILN
jgi:tetratricopeptide (TPR) repeat protein